MKIRKFSELREAAKDKAAKAQTTTKDKESDLFGTSRIKGEQDFRDAHGLDVKIKANKLKDNDHFSPNMKPATHRADGEKQPVRQGNSSQPGPTKLFQVKEEDVAEGKMDKLSLSNLWHKHAEHSYAADQGFGHGSNSMRLNQHAAKAIEKHVTKKHGSQVSKDMISHSDAQTAHSEYLSGKEAKDALKDAAKLRKKHGIQSEDIEQIEMNEDVFSSLKALASSNKSGNLKFKNGETGLVNSQSAGKIVAAYNKLSPENAKQMKIKMNSDVVGFMKVLHFVDKSAKAV
jgi:predicted transcriptional regulator